MRSLKSVFRGVTRKNICAIFCIQFAVSVHSIEPDFPTSGALLYPKSGDVKSSLFNIECSAPNRPTSIDCRTTQIIFRKKDVPPIDELLSSSEYQGWVSGKNKGKKVKWCDELKSNQSAFVNSSDGVQQVIAHWTEFCGAETPKEMKRHLASALELSLQRQANACQPLLLTDQYSFEWQQQSGKWRSVSEANDDCGTVVIMTLSSEGKGILWEFEQNTVFTNLDGETFVGSCRDRAEARKETMAWSWNGQPIEKNCQIIGDP